MVEIYINNYIIVAFMNILSIVILMVCSSLIVAMEVDEVNLTPYITEFIVPFNTPTQDLRTLIERQLSSNQFRTSKFTSDHVSVQNLIYKAKYNGTGRTITPDTTSSFHRVTGDNFDLVVMYHAIVHPQLATKKSYNCSTKLKVYFDYTKEIDVNDGSIQFQTPKVTVDVKSFEMSYSGSPSKGDKQKLDEINKGEISKLNPITILKLLQDEEFAAAIMLRYFKDNVVEQKLSPTYNSTYQYTFNSANITFDMTTALVRPIENGIAHSVKGFIKNFNNYHAMQSKVEAVNSGQYSTLITLNFIANFMQYNVQKNPDWVNLKLDLSTFKTRVFQFRLLDLEFIFDNLLAKYARYYLSSIRAICNPKSFDAWQFEEQGNHLTLNIQWQCQGYLLGPQPSPLIMDFDAEVKYNAELSVQNDMLYVYVSSSTLESLKFKLVSDFILVDFGLAETYAKQIVSLIRGYMIGTNFRLKAGSTQVTLRQDEGIWIS